MIQLKVWNIGIWWSVQVVQECRCGCEPYYYFNEDATDEIELKKLVGEAMGILKTEIELEKKRNEV